MDSVQYQKQQDGVLKRSLFRVSILISFHEIEYNSRYYIRLDNNYKHLIEALLQVLKNHLAYFMKYLIGNTLNTKIIICLYQYSLNYNIHILIKQQGILYSDYFKPMCLENLNFDHKLLEYLITILDCFKHQVNSILFVVNVCEHIFMTLLKI